MICIDLPSIQEKYIHRYIRFQTASEDICNYPIISKNIYKTLIQYKTHHNDFYSDIYKLLIDKIHLESSNLIYFGDTVEGSNDICEIYNIINPTGKNTIYNNTYHVDASSQNIITVKYSRKQNIIRAIIYAIYVQKKVGYTIVCVDEIYNHFIIDVLYILCSVFEKVQIIKTDSTQKYILCKNIAINTVEINELIQKIEHIPEELNIYRMLTIDMPYHFIVCLEEMNVMFGQNQIERFGKPLKK